MAQLDPRSSKDKNSRNFGNDNNFNWRGILLFACAIALLGGFLFSRNGNYGNVEEINFTDFEKYLDEGRISKEEPLQLIVTEGRSTQVLRGAYEKGKEAVYGGRRSGPLQDDGIHGVQQRLEIGTRESWL